ncbi:MAG: FHA domain-containing protein [Lentisphaeria bacterium]|nr:FHA domain-containing protein [Lentisphaeria bacterium]
MKHLANVRMLSLLSLFTGVAAFGQSAYPRYTPAPHYSANAGGGISTVQIVLIIGFALVFLLVMALFIGFIIFMNNKAKRDRELLIQAINQGREEGKSSLRATLHQLEDELERVRREVPNISADVMDEVTEIIANSQGKAQIMLIHMGGQRDSAVEHLLTRDPVTGKPKKVTIGKNQDSADIAIPWDSKISRPHCQICFEPELEGDHFYVFDMNSTNGVFVKRDTNGEFERVNGKCFLEDGYVLQIGMSNFRVLITQPVVTGEDQKLAPTVSSFN